MSRPPVSAPILIWIVVCAWLNASGWILSAMSALNHGGYAVSITLLGLVLWKTRRTRCWPRLPRHRFRRTLPRLWLALAAMVLAGALIYPPSSFDSLSYREPRVLHWLAAQQWHWIHGNYEILNTRATGFEFVIAPWMLFTHTDRWCVLINVAGFLLLPGLVFSVFRQLGMGARAAWSWMWVVPTGYCYLLQAGGMANDAYGAVCALAMMHYALRARSHRTWSDAALAVIAGALTTGAKSGNLPLLLPAAIALLPSVPLLLRRPLATASVLACGLLVSLVPISLMNLKYAGTWFGSREDYAVSTGGPWQIALPANVLLLKVNNGLPPILPGAGAISARLGSVTPSWLREGMERYFKIPGGVVSMRETQLEDGSGLGFGVSWLTAFTALAGLWHRGRAPRRQASDGALAIIRWSAWLSLLAVLLKNFIEAIARLLTPYYALLLVAPLVALRTEHIVRTAWWRRAAFANAVLAALLLVANPARPLWPALTVCRWLRSRAPHSAGLARFELVFATFRERPDVLAPVRALLPKDERVIGIVDHVEPEASLWRPFGSRWVQQVTRSDTRGSLDQRGIHTVVVVAPDGQLPFDSSLEQWLDAVGGRIVHTVPIRTLARMAPVDWHVVRLEPQSRP